MNSQGQSHKRILLLSGISNYGAIIVSIIVGLISVPIGLNYFGTVLYGIWFVISSILAYLRLSDFGIGLSTLTLIARTSYPSHQRTILRRSIGLLLGISIAFIVLIIIITHSFPGWVGILGRIPSNFQEEAAKATLAIIILIFFQLPTTIFSSVFSGLQQVHWNPVYSIFQSIIALGALVATILIGGNLVTLAVFTGLGGLLVGILSGIHLFYTHPYINPIVTEKATDAPSTKLLFTNGSRFFALQIAVLIIWNTDNLVISHFLGAEKVAPYAITFKLFQIGLMMVTASIIALWPLYAQASSRGDWEWIQRTYNRSTFLQVTCGGLIWIGGIIFSQVIINLWAGPVAYGGIIVAFALGGYAYISSFGGSNTSLINGLNPTNSVVVIGLVEAALNLGISLALVVPLGIGGVAIGTFFASLAVNSWFGPLYIRSRTMKKVLLEIKPILIHAFIVLSCVIFALFTVLYLPLGLHRIFVGFVIITLYMALSWWVMPDNIQYLTKATLRELYARIRNESKRL